MLVKSGPVKMSGRWATDPGAGVAIGARTWAQTAGSGLDLSASELSGAGARPRSSTGSGTTSKSAGSSDRVSAARCRPSRSRGDPLSGAAGAAANGAKPTRGAETCGDVSAPGEASNPAPGPPTSAPLVVMTRWRHRRVTTPTAYHVKWD